MAIYLVDVSRKIASQMMKRRSLFTVHGDHQYYELTDDGLSRSNALLIARTLGAVPGEWHNEWVASQA